MSPSQDADTIIRRYIKDQHPAEEDIQEEFNETRPQHESEVALSSVDSRQKHARLSGGDLDVTMVAGSSGDEAIGGFQSLRIKIPWMSWGRRPVLPCRF